MTKSITSDNLSEAATSVSQYCAKNAKGKAKVGAVREALSHFMGYKNSNAALADASSTTTKNEAHTHPVSFILHWKGIPTVHTSVEMLAADLYTELTAGEYDMDSLTVKTMFSDDSISPLISIHNGTEYVVNNLYGDGIVSYPLISIHRIEMIHEHTLKKVSESQRSAFEQGDKSDVERALSEIMQTETLSGVEEYTVIHTPSGEEVQGGFSSRKAANQWLDDNINELEPPRFNDYAVEQCALSDEDDIDDVVYDYSHIVKIEEFESADDKAAFMLNFCRQNHTRSDRAIALPLAINRDLKEKAGYNKAMKIYEAVKGLADNNRPMSSSVRGLLQSNVIDITPADLLERWDEIHELYERAVRDIKKRIDTDVTVMPYAYMAGSNHAGENAYYSCDHCGLELHGNKVRYVAAGTRYANGEFAPCPRCQEENMIDRDDAE